MSEVFEKIAGEIQKRGSISFARFMEIALYCPVYGYYEKERDTIGRHGDYYTSPAVGPLFGELLGSKFADWFEESPQSTVHSPQSTVAEQVESIGVHSSESKPPFGGMPSVGAATSEAENGPECPGHEGLLELTAPEEGRPPRNYHFQIIEAGAHRGQLARDMLNWMRTRRPKVFESLEYCIVEPSPRRCEWQQSTLKEFAPQIRWVGNVAELGPKTEPGSETETSITPFRVLFCNELLDAMPVHRLGWDAKEKRWFEWGITSQNGRFGWTRMGLTDQQSGFRRAKTVTVQPPAVPAELLEVFPDGFTTEICPVAVDWWRQAAEILPSGKLVAIDYGLTTEELFIPERQQGTLRVYREHQLSSDILQNPGEQDLTAHVNFSAIREAGEAAGLNTEALVTQEQFLGAIAAAIWKGQTDFGEWMANHTRQFRTLTHPELMGRAFKVLIQSRTKPEARS